MTDDAWFSGSVSRASEVLVQQLPDDETIFLDLRTESYFGLDRVGTKMYRALVETGSPQAAFERLSVEFEVPAATLRTDLRAFVERMVRKGILEHRA